VTSAVASTVDCHLHVVDAVRWPYPPGPGNKPAIEEQAPFERLIAELDRADVERGVLIQLSGYATDNRPMLDAVARAPTRLRCVIGLSPEVSTHDIEALAAAGAAGARLNVLQHGCASIATVSHRLNIFADLGWVADVQCNAVDLPAFLPILKVARCPIVLDHMGWFDISRGISDPGFQALLRFGREGANIKLSAAFRLSRLPFPHPDLDPFVDAILTDFTPARCVWGSDWPFVGVAPAPSYRESRACLERWVNDPDERRLILCETPTRLFGFKAAVVVTR